MLLCLRNFLGQHHPNPQPKNTCAAFLLPRSFFAYPPAYMPLTGEPGSFSMMDIGPEDAQKFYSTHPKERQVGAIVGGWGHLAGF